MRRTLLIFLLIVASGLSAAPTFLLQLYLNTDNCFQCERSLGQLKNLDPEIQLEIHVQTKDKNILGEYLEKFELPATRYSVKFHKSIRFDEKHHMNSFFRLVVNGKFFCKFYNDLLSMYLPGLNSLGFLRDTTFTIALPDTNVYSDYITAFTNGDIININDSKLGKNLTYQVLPAQNKALLLSKLYAKKMNYEDFFALGAMDTSFYMRYREEALKRGILPTFRQAIIDDSMLCLLFSVPYYYFSGQDTLRWDSRTFLLEKKLDGSVRRMAYVKTEVHRNKDSTQYFIDEAKGFSRINGNLIFPTFPYRYKSDVSYRYVEMSRDVDTLKPLKLRLKMNRKTVEKYKLDDGLAFSNAALGYAVNDKVIYRLDDNKALVDQAQVRSGGDVLDVRLNGSFVQFITASRSEKITALLYDRLTGKEILRKHIVFPEKIKTISVRIMKEHYLVAMSETGEKLIFVSF